MTRCGPVDPPEDDDDPPADGGGDGDGDEPDNGEDDGEPVSATGFGSPTPNSPHCALVPGLIARNTPPQPSRSW